MKKPLLGPCDSYQLEPFEYPWAWEMARECEQNTWTPEEIPVAGDVAQWKGTLLEEERHLFLSIMSQLTTFDIQRGDDAAETFLALLQPAEIKHFLKRLVWEEALHTRSYRYVIENMGLDLEIYDRWRTVPAMKARIDLGNRLSDAAQAVYTKRVRDPSYEFTTRDKQEILFAMIFWFLCFEGVWFVMGLSGPVQALARTGKFEGAAEQFRYILRDEFQHIRFGQHVVKEYMAQYPECMTDSFKDAISRLMETTIGMERDYIVYCLPNPILGYNTSDHVETAKWYANLRMHAIGLDPVYTGVEHKFPWMAEMTNIRKETNFFEKRPTEYRTGGALSWD